MSIAPIFRAATDTTISGRDVDAAITMFPTKALPQPGAASNAVVYRTIVEFEKVLVGFNAYSEHVLIQTLDPIFSCKKNGRLRGIGA